jgi:MFS transporter, MHS family, shikimate and dehydroshikimate transport protein
MPSPTKYEMFDARVRYSATSLGYQIGGMLGGGFAPLILSTLLASQGGAPWAIPPYMILLAVLTFAAVYVATSRTRTPREVPA